MRPVADPQTVRARRLSARALWGLASWALPLAVIFAVTPLLLSTLGSERFGVLMIILVAPALASQMDLGITTSSIRRMATALATGRVDAGRTLFTLTMTLGAIGAFLGALIWSAAPPLSRWLGFTTALGDELGVQLIRWCAVWIAVSLVMLMPVVLARSAQALVWITAVQTLGSALLWLSALALIRSGRPLADVVAVGIVLSFASAGVMAVAMRRHVDWSEPIGFDAALLTADRRFSAGMFASQAASALVYQGDRVLIAAVGSTAIAGAYALCTNVANKSLAAVVALTSFAFPHAAGLYALGERERLEEFVHVLDRAVAVIVSPLLLPGWLLAGPFLMLWLGDYGTPELALVFRILWLAFAIPAFAVPIGHALAASGNSGLAARFSWLTACIVTGSILLLVPFWGAPGAALAMLLGMSTSFIFSAAARKTLALRPAPGRGRFWLGIIFGLAVQLVPLMTLRTSVTGWVQLLVLGAAAVLVFYFVRAIFGLLSPEENQLLQRLSIRRRQARDL